jgi:hypothetical protein|tara:strand:+ start:123 stop:455 length:333 start_codon:yes stop_codon:yes gene_type:complete
MHQGDVLMDSLEMRERMEESKAVLDALTVEGSVLTVNIKIEDSYKAQQLMDTMNGHNVSTFGVSVESWGFNNITKAESIRLDKIKTEGVRHISALNDIYQLTHTELLGEE